MRFPVLSRFLVALGFLAVQTAALVHATGHELKAESSASCEVCAMAHAGGGAPATIDASAILVPRGIEPVAPAVIASPTRNVARPHSRGPPAILV